MRFVTYVGDGGEPRPGALLGDGEQERVLDLRGAVGAVGAPSALSDELLVGLPSLFAAGRPALDAVRELIARVEQLRAAQSAGVVHALADVRLLAPIPRPPRLRAYLTTAKHAQNTDFFLADAFYEMPIAYDGNVNAVIGPEQELPWPAYTDQLDYGLQLALVVGKAGIDLSVEQAAEHIAGVTLLNDVSARDVEAFEMLGLLGPNKGKHFCNVVGPSVATLDALDEDGFELEARVNGELWSRATSGDRQFSFAEVVAWASWGEQLQPGEVIGLGTVAGGSGLELDRWIQPGDVVELACSGVGVLRNRVGAKQRTPGAGLPTYAGAPPAPRAGSLTDQPYVFAVPATPVSHDA